MTDEDKHLADFVLGGEDKVSFGKYYGESWRVVPWDYLHWVNHNVPKHAARAKQEIERRKEEVKLNQKKD